MKKILLSTLLLIIGLTTYAAVWQSQGEAEITFEKTIMLKAKFSSLVPLFKNYRG